MESISVLDLTLNCFPKSGVIMKSLSQLAHFYFWQALREAVGAAVMVKSSVSPIRSALQVHGVATPTPGRSAGRERTVRFQYAKKKSIVCL